MYFYIPPPTPQSIIRFWLDRGVDGFRVDAIQQLFVAANYTLDEPLSGGPSLPVSCSYIP